MFLSFYFFSLESLCIFVRVVVFIESGCPIASWMTSKFIPMLYIKIMFHCNSYWINTRLYLNCFDRSLNFVAIIHPINIWWGIQGCLVNGWPSPKSEATIYRFVETSVDQNQSLIYHFIRNFTTTLWTVDFLHGLYVNDHDAWVKVPQLIEH